jgi:hypothetical protein
MQLVHKCPILLEDVPVVVYIKNRELFYAKRNLAELPKLLKIAKA